MMMSQPFATEWTPTWHQTIWRTCMQQLVCLPPPGLQILWLLTIASCCLMRPTTQRSRTAKRWGRLKGKAALQLLHGLGQALLLHADWGALLLACICESCCCCC